MSPRHSSLPALPEALLAEPPTVKLLWVWLAPQGTLSHSVRQLGRSLGLDPSNVHAALARLRALGLIEDLEGPESRRKGRYRVRVFGQGQT